MKTQPHPPFHKALLQLLRDYRPSLRMSLPVNARRFLPSPGSTLFTLLLLAGLFWAQTAGALPLPQAASSISTIPYQGRLADAGGLPLTGTYTMVFRLYAASTEGVPLWEEQWTGPNGVQVSDGLFNVMLGSLSPIAPSVITTNPNLWLGVTVGTDDEMTPRIQIGTLPFAVQALTVPDAAITTAKLADDAVTSATIADGTIVTADLADGAVTSATIADGTIVTADLADGAVTSATIADGTIVTADLANGAVTSAKLGPDINLVPPDGSIGTVKLANGAVTPEKIADSAVTSSKLRPTYGQVYGSPAGPFMLNTTRQRIPGMIITVSPTTHQVLHLSATVDATRQGTCDAVVTYLALNGNLIKPLVLSGAGSYVRASISASFQIALAPGTHTIEALAFCQTGSGAQINPENSTLAYILFAQ
ncbi:hypothetical protein EYB53_004425 [Candidatus Chloroploca sp. M-50]|uniref:Uncharacterized protein n=1 Tax=Candidatus Chloroploca mongolica TaxID=2528176 RepID=A0ABS4D694_9CHLR|nr:hypothetical protein [Candidatus Chloroploca mongolica]MBP1464949.1 hypothetical protein [Candidatus Chloroploca mongolica]